MNLPEFCIRRPAFTIVISLVMTIIGVIGFMGLPIRWVPNVVPPQVTISTSYAGANAHLMETDVTKVIEDALSGTDGIEMLTSNSRQGQSEISIQFKLGTNMDAAVEGLRSSIERIRGNLPKDADSPVVTKADPNGQAILYVSFNDTQRSDRELSDYIDKYIVPVFETIDGVGSVSVFGERLSALRVWLDPLKMAAAKVTTDEVTQLLRDQSASVPSGQIRTADRYYSVLTNTGLKAPEQFNNLVIRDNQNQLIRLKDIAEAKLEAKDTDSAFRMNGKNGIALGIVPQSTANPLDVEQQVQKKFAELKRSLPVSMQASIIYNQADYIRASIHSVYESFIEAVLFVWLVILGFLCSFRATLIPIITVPVCIISTFSFLYFLGFSINTITLMALVLAIGLVVDDAIVMLENISRYMEEEGMTALNAALKGSREIIFPIIAMTLTLTAVYAPIAFTPGLLGVIFREFTYTLAGAVLVSGIVALTLSPMMCARILAKIDHTHRYAQWQNQQFTRLQMQYQRMLRAVLNKRQWVVLGLVAIGALGFWVYKSLPAELAPTEDMNSIYVAISAPHSASFAYTDTYVRQMESLYKEIPDIQSYLSLSGMLNPSHAMQLLILKPHNERKHSLDELIESLNAQAKSISGVKVNVFAPPPPLAEIAGSDDSDRLGLVLMTTSDYRELQQYGQKLVDAIKPLPIFSHVDHSLKWDSEEFLVNIDRDRAADLGVPISSIASTLSTLIAGKNIGKMDDANGSDIILQMNNTSLANPNIFQQIYIRNNDNQMVPLSSMLSLNETSASEIYKHYDRLRADTIYLTLDPAYKISAAIEALQKVAQQTLPDDIKYSFTGEAKSFLESNGKIAFTFMLALIFIYLVLVAQFESFIDPLIILFTVPFAMVGALLSLKLFGGTLNIYSNIGLITLIGLIAKHGILITDFANRLRSTGKSINEAVIKAAMQRLRPILMTTAAMVLGALPLAFARGPGSLDRQQIGLIIAGGLLFGTFFSLIVVPILYTYLAPFRRPTVRGPLPKTAIQET